MRRPHELPEYHLRYLERETGLERYGDDCDKRQRRHLGSMCRRGRLFGIEPAVFARLIELGVLAVLPFSGDPGPDALPVFRRMVKFGESGKNIVCAYRAIWWKRYHVHDSFLSHYPRYSAAQPSRIEL